jgi:hypothetical protein
VSSVRKFDVHGHACRVARRYDATLEQLLLNLPQNSLRRSDDQVRREWHGVPTAFSTREIVRVVVKDFDVR